jgi:[protein-PII] uridylyltransferase
VPTLLEKIEADAERRLPLPVDCQPAEELGRYKNFLKVESHRLKIHHRGGAGGREICHARAAVLDLLQRYLLEAVKQLTPLTAKEPPRLALVAIGGYGRGELNPHSDIDIMLLHDSDSIMITRGKLHPLLAALTNPGGLLYTLYDLGLKVGHSLRTIDDCVRVANSDMQSKTSLIEARRVAGDEELFKKMQAVVLARCVRGHEADYIAARIQDQEARRAKFGNSACRQEPNIKNGCGGLRDYQNLVWMAFFKYRVRSLEDLEEHDQIRAGERKQLETAYDFLLRVRNELHYQARRAVDVLTKSIQPSVAYELGYQDRSPVKRLERFMHDFYTHSRNIYLITRTIEQRLALVPPPKSLRFIGSLIPGRRARSPETIDGLKFIDGEIHANSNRIFRDQPRRLMRVFLHAQQRGLRLHPELAQLIRNELSLVEKNFLRDQHVHGTFLEILNQRGNVAPTLRTMHEVGFLGKYMPEFGDLTCLVQHEFYHQYTADEHTLVCLEKLDAIRAADHPPFSHYAEMFQKLERPFVLYLALLLHDSGKACDTSKHAEISSKLAARVAKRLGLDPVTTHTLRLLIENHLLMAQISQRRDLDDPAVLRHVAGIVKTTENLALLTLHTFADSQGTSDQLWNDFKDSLLRALYHKTKELLAEGTEFIRAEAQHREALAVQVRAVMPPSFSDDELLAHFRELPARYFQIQPAREIVTDLSLVHRFMHLQMSESEHGLEPVISWHNEPDRGYTAVKVCTWNRTGLFSKITGSLTAAAMNILSAQIFSRNDGIIIDTFFVHDALTGKLPDRESREKFEGVLKLALTDQIDFPSLIARIKAGRPLYQSLEGEQMPTVIQFDNATSDTRTVIDLETEDRVGLLYTISQALAGLGLDISLAKITTEKGAAIDSFYLTELDGGKILSPERMYEIENTLRAAIPALDGRKTTAE